MRRAVRITNVVGRTTAVPLVAPNGRRYLLERRTAAERASASLVYVWR